MANSTRQYGLLSGRYMPHFAAVLVTAIAMAGFMFLGSSEKERDLLRYRSYTLSQLNAASERLQNIINSSLIHIEGLSAFVSIHPEISITEFDEFASQIIAQHKSIHSIELVKGTVISGYIYPLKGNESAIGVDLMSLPTDRETVRNAIDTKKTVIAGPINLIQGGIAFISRAPIFISSGKKSSQKDKYWGLAQAIITTEAVFKEAGLYDKSSDLYFAIRGKDAKGAAGDVFFGDKAVFQSNPLTLEIPLFNGSWQFAAMPKAGWESVSVVPLWLKALRLAISLALGSLVFCFLRSQQNILKSEERHRNIFHNASVSIWEEDFSEVKTAIDDLKAQGVVDFRKYIDENPEFARKAAQMAKVIDVNDATLKLYKAKSTDELLGSLDKVFTPESYEVFKEVLVAVAEGKTYFEAEAINRNLQGEPFNILITISIPSETSGFRNLLVSILDISERKRTEEELRLLLSMAHAVSKSGDIRLALRETLREVCETTGWKVGEAWIPSPKGTEIEYCTVYYDGLDKMAAKFGISSKEFTFSPGVGLPGRVWASKQPVWIEDVTKDPNFPRADIAKETGIKAALGVPVLAGNEAVAVLGFYMTEALEENKRFTRLVSAVASQLGEIFLLKRAENTIRENEERLRSLTQTAVDAIISADSAGNIISWNRGAQNIFGYGEDEALGKPLTILIPERYRDAHDKGLERVSAGGETRIIGKTIEVYGLRKSGSEFPLELSLATWTTGKGIFFTGIVRDITERKKAEEALKKYSEELEERVRERTRSLESANTELKTIFNAIEQSTESVIITDINGTIQYVNPAFTRIAGYSKADAIGKNPNILKSGKNPPDMYNELWGTILSGSMWRGTTINKKKSGEIYYEEMTITPVLDEHGEIINFVAIKKDVTDRVKAEEELRQKNVELEAAKDLAEAANRAKSEFLANMSHELRTPLNAVIGFSEVIKDGMAGPVTDAQKEYANDILESGRHLLSIITDILDLSRIEAGKEELEITEFPLDVLIKESLMMFNEKAIKHNIKLTTDVAGDIGDIKADARKIKQVIINLLSNAIKFTPDGGSVRVSARRVRSSEIITPPSPPLILRGGLEGLRGGEGELIEISVEDTGIGIKEEDMQRLFRPFEQLEKHLTKQYAGTGLGLTLCKKFVEMHRGRIWAESEFGKGSRFIFTIPVE